MLSRMWCICDRLVTFVLLGGTSVYRRIFLLAVCVCDEGMIRAVLVQCVIECFCFSRFVNLPPTRLYMAL